MLVDVLIVVLIMMLIASLPMWRYSRAWGYYGAGGVGVLLWVVVVLLLLHAI